MTKFDDLQAKYMWKTRGSNCSLCNAMAGRVYTYDTWVSTSVLPGFHLNCDCYLEKVSADYPVSDLDIFGSDFNITLDNIFLLRMFNLKPDYTPYNRFFTNQISELMSQGMTIGEAVKSLNIIGRNGVIHKSLSSLWDQFFQWRVFRSLLPFNKNGDGETISATLEPHITIPSPAYPDQTYRSGMPEDTY